MKNVWCWAAVLAVVGGCGPKETNTAAKEVARWKPQAGETIAARIKLAIEQDVTQGGRARHIGLEFEGVEEENVGAAAGDGAVTVTARLADIAGKAASGADQKTVDQFALALDELKIQFRRSARAETDNLSISGVRAPLDEDTARSIVRAVFSAGRGPLLPERGLGVGATWRVETPLSAGGGFEGKLIFAYNVVKKDGSVYVINSDGKLEGATKGGAKKLTGSSSAEFRFDTARSAIVSTMIDSNTEVVDAGGGNSVKQRLRVEWTRK